MRTDPSGAEILAYLTLQDDGKNNGIHRLFAVA